jgi:hypothetical protein
VLIVVGGHSRKVGKTSVIAGLIRALADAGWTAVKISPHEHALEERATSDSSRYLAAGARRSLLLRAPAPDAVRLALEGAQNAIVESNSALDFLNPDLYLMVLDFSVSDFKESARAHLDRVGAFVVIESAVPQPLWPGLPPGWMEGKPVFTVKPPDYTSLIEFVSAFIRVHLRLDINSNHRTG